ncbi:MAG: TIGR02678 family protein [Acidimicrobiales bacterium]
MSDDRRDAARALLQTPVVTATVDPGLHRMVRRHEEDLAKFLRGYLGYRLSADSRIARLYKAGLGEGNGRPLTKKDKAPFTPRDYTYLALVCSVLLTTRSQVLISAVASDVRQAAAEAGVDLGGDTLPERRSLVHALRQLIEWGAVTEDVGSVADFADDPSKEALLWVERDLVRSLLAVPLREVDDPAELVRSASHVDDESLRHSVRRKIVENPVVMLTDLTEAEAAWLRQNQRREAQLLEDNLGLQLEIRAEGVAAFDPLGELTDIRFPREGTLGQAALLAVAELVAALKPAGPASEVSLPAGMLDDVVGRLLAEHRSRWSKDYTERPERLVADVCDLLVSMGLVAEGPGGTLALRAAAGRYGPEPEVSYPAALALEDG